jgi:hypothetical protein
MFKIIFQLQKKSPKTYTWKKHTILGRRRGGGGQEGLQKKMCVLVSFPHSTSATPLLVMCRARLGPKAAALAWLELANLRAQPKPPARAWLGLGLAQATAFGREIYLYNVFKMYRTDDKNKLYQGLETRYISSPCCYFHV